MSVKFAAMAVVGDLVCWPGCPSLGDRGVNPFTSPRTVHQTDKADNNCQYLKFMSILAAAGY